jgi:hypothetical protein
MNGFRFAVHEQGDWTISEVRDSWDKDWINKELGFHEIEFQQRGRTRVCLGDS